MAKARKERSEKLKQVDEAVELCSGLGGVFGKFGSLIEKLGELAEKGGEWSKTGEIQGLDRGGKLRGVYGVSIRTASGPEGEQEFKVEPFGNVGRAQSGETEVRDVCEPLVDVHEEEDHILVVAEIPGVSKKDTQVTLRGRQLILDAQRGERHYHKEVDLPVSFSEHEMRWDCKNGILTVRLVRA